MAGESVCALREFRRQAMMTVCAWKDWWAGDYDEEHALVFTFTAVIVHVFRCRVRNYSRPCRKRLLLVVR